MKNFLLDTVNKRIIRLEKAFCLIDSAVNKFLLILIFTFMFGLGACGGGGDSSENDPGYTVSFESNGGSAISQITGVKSGNTIIVPAVPTKTGYSCIFVGWYKEEGLTNAWDFASDTVTDSITLYAKWRSYNICEIGPAG